MLKNQQFYLKGVLASIGITKSTSIYMCNHSWKIIIVNFVFDWKIKRKDAISIAITVNSIWMNKVFFVH